MEEFISRVEHVEQVDGGGVEEVRVTKLPTIIYQLPTYMQGELRDHENSSGYV